MRFCPACGTERPAAARFCPSCGAALDRVPDVPRPPGARSADPLIDMTAAPTAAPGFPDAPATPAPNAGPRPPSSVRFEPGAILAGRYRLVALLGKGGMGEVYRADDLTLDQPVALKFLPAGVANSAARLAQFHGELRVARQVSHKNVCRLYDLGDADGRRFITMEYIDGEDLASLLRRIGRVPQDKAIEFARQLCAGLSAAHERGVLHRDLKPANVMIDGTGNVRLTDFGLAGIEGEREAGLAGTPQYMAPEQLAGQPASIATDLYALGLVLFEIFTGRRAYDARTLHELVALHESGSRPTPSSIVRDLDPAIERVILRCLEKDPQRRPGSALAVAAALPGADPLAAALAAGETPSPELLIAAGESDAVPVGRALTAALLTLAAFAAFVLISMRGSIPALVPLDRSPAVLIDHIHRTVAALGYPDESVDDAYGFSAPPDYPEWARKTSTRPDWWSVLRSGSPPALVFWYRTSPRPMAPLRPVASISPTDPPPDVPGMISVVTDTRGRLVEFHATPPQFDPSATSPVTPHWQALFDAAGLDRAAFKPVTPEWTPRDYADVRAAWQGPLAGHPDITIRVEAAAYRGRPTSFSIVGPWTRPIQTGPVRQSTSQFITGILNVVVWCLAIFGAVLLARRHLRAHRADLRSANRVTLVVFLGFTVGWLIAAHHTPAPLVELERFVVALGISLGQAAQVWVLYLAIEPYARRFWPDGLLGWTRLVSGHLHDARVGRDVLLGALMGTAFLATDLAQAIVPTLAGAKADVPPFGASVDMLGHWTAMPIGAVQLLYGGIESGLVVALVFVVLRLLLRRAWLAAALVVLLFVTVSNAGAFVSGGWLEAVFGLIVMGLLTFTVVRFGLLTITVALFVSNLLSSVPLSPSPSDWWATSGNLSLILLAGLVAFGFYAARAGQPLFGRLVAEE